MAEGYEGWDDYAPFYDWENARTLGRRDVPFWRNLALQVDGPVLELGCGTGRISIPLGRAGVSIVGIDRSEPMLARARQRIRRARLGGRVRLIRGDIRYLPFLAARPRRSLPLGADTTGLPRRSSSGRSAPTSEGGFSLVIAPYGVLQSLLRERDLAATLEAVAARASARCDVRARARGRPAVLEGVQETRQPLWLAGRPRRSACDPRRDRASGSGPPPDNLRPAVRRAARIAPSGPPVRPDVSDLVGAADDEPSAESRL